ncbi:glycosyltransferase family 32 protein [Flavobacterium sp.]|uniref:glycosyltransferase family 32 protein n=1 Tax=Flavobacterium sp. TaxID=239 RepID=UPI00263199B6|nr:glycosyltransferase [Flavobacterium sp.]
MIPKIIHYCWFGNNPKTQLINYCIESWKKYLPDYEIIEWNESNFNLNENEFVKSAYKNKKWAFVSDYVRAYVLYLHGGIYLDSDVEIKQNLNQFLHHGAFSGFEKSGFPFTALWASQKNHIWPKKVLDYYNGLETYSEETNTIIVTQILIDEFEVNPNNDVFQLLKNDIAIYPSHFFCLDLNQNFATHHFNGSWLDAKIPFKENLHRHYYSKKYFETLSDKSILQDLLDYNDISLKETFVFFIRSLLKKVNKRIAKLVKI